MLNYQRVISTFLEFSSSQWFNPGCALPRILTVLLQLSPRPRRGGAGGHHAAGAAVVTHGQVEPVGLQGVVLRIERIESDITGLV